MIELPLKRKRKLANLLLRNYILLYFLMTLIFVISIIVFAAVGIFSFGDIEDPMLTAKQIMRDDYKNINTSEIIKAGGFIEVIDNKYNVVFRQGHSINTIEKYTKKEFYKMLVNNEYDENFNNDYIFSFAYNQNKDFLLATAIPNNSFADFYYKKDSKITPELVFKIALWFYIVSLILGIIVYSRLTSKSFVMPLKILLDGVRSISKGDYSARINLKSENEFGELRDAFNLMAEKIEVERNLKEKSEESRRRLILDISHDLKNPLASVIGYSDLLIKNPTLSEEERIKYLTVIETNSIRANNLIKDLFEFSKFESIDFKMDIKKEDICEFLRELIALYIPQMEEKGIDYDFHIPEYSIIIPFNNKNLDRAISNLILNSIKYNPTDIKVSISIKENIDNIEIIIKDDGIGIPKELTKDIFNPFKRVDSARNSKTGGTGLGLAITKTIIEKHCGTIHLETDCNKGCEFTILLNK